MLFGESEGARAWLVGEENRGLAAMFVMMNAARLAVGTQGVAIAERAYQQALGICARPASGPRAERRWHGADHRARRRSAHADDDEGVCSCGARICHLTAASLDLANHGRTPDERAAGANRAALLTPIAKAFSTDIGDEAASLGVQVHGGMGFVEETGAAQHMRDSRIAAIYEGANGIHAIDLVQRKLPLDGGETVKEEITAIRAIARSIGQRGEAFGAMGGRLSEATDALDQATRDMQRWLAGDPQSALAGASQYLRLFGLDAGRRMSRKGRTRRGGACCWRKPERTGARRPSSLLRRKAAPRGAGPCSRHRLGRRAAKFP